MHETERANPERGAHPAQRDRVSAAQALELTTDDFQQKLSSYGISGQLVAH
jgi:hypothetical protein